MVAMAGLQVFIVKMFFTGGRKGESCGCVWGGLEIMLMRVQGTCELRQIRTIDICCKSTYKAATRCQSQVSRSRDGRDGVDQSVLVPPSIGASQSLSCDGDMSVSSLKRTERESS